MANSLLQAKFSHRASINPISRKMKKRIKKLFSEFMCGGPNKKPRYMRRK